MIQNLNHCYGETRNCSSIQISEVTVTTNRLVHPGQPRKRRIYRSTCKPAICSITRQPRTYLRHNPMTDTSWGHRAWKACEDWMRYCIWSDYLSSLETKYISRRTKMDAGPGGCSVLQPPSSVRWSPNTMCDSPALKADRNASAVVTRTKAPALSEGRSQ
jgi:hypothetical protein